MDRDVVCFIIIIIIIIIITIIIIIINVIFFSPEGRDEPGDEALRHVGVSQTRDYACRASGTQHTNVSGRLCHAIYHLF